MIEEKNMKINLDVPEYERWWHVTTEDDCEGRKIKDLGFHFGKVENIAWQLSGSSYYVLDFSPEEPEKKSKIEERLNVWVRIKPFWFQAPNANKEGRIWTKEWLEKNGVKCIIKTDLPSCTYYGAVYLEKNQ